MAVEVQLGTLLAESLQNVVQPKLVEMGWSTGGLDDSALAEYIILMLVNGKTQDQIAAELSNDLLGLGPEDSGATDFTRWLFEQVGSLSGQTTQNSDMANEYEPSLPRDADFQNADVGQAMSQDADMDDTVDNLHNGTIPTGPKSMRSNVPKPRDKRLLGQMNKAMDRTGDATLHRVRGAAGAGRINSHAREPPKGPTPRGPRSLNPMNRNQAMPQTRQVNGLAIGAMATHSPFGTMTPQQQMQLMAMYEEQARMMAQIFSPQQAQQMFPAQMGLHTAGHQPQPQQAGRSLFDRVQNKPHGLNGGYNGRHKQNGHQAQAMATGTTDQNLDLTSSMEVENNSPPAEKSDPSTTMCQYNLTCTRVDCHFVHQSPAAPPGVTIDMGDTCSFGAACQNFKCVGRHPSPAQKAVHKAEQECKYYPNCTNPTCPFRHPTKPPCRNGGDCSVPGCTFSHSKIICKYNPCLNPACPFKHVEGQSRGAFHDRVWINPEEIGGEGGSQEHVSERKFVDDEAGEEELILPGKFKQEQGDQVEQIAA